MPESTPRHKLELEDLSLHEGATVLLRRALARLAEGEWCEVHGDSPELADHLVAWCRKQGLRCQTRQGAPQTIRIEAPGPAPLILTSCTEIAESAEPNWGISPRGARIERGGPEFGFTLRQKRDVWARELNSIYSQATANQWSAARDISWNELTKLPTDVEAAVAQVMTFLTENEFAALYVPARFIPRIHPHYREVVEVLAMQVVDEARHGEAFTRRAEAGGAGLGTTAVSGQLSLKTLLEEPDFTTATFLLCVMGEGTFLTLLKFLADYAPDPVTAALARLAHRDEARHVAFGVEHMRYVFEREPEMRLSMASAVEKRSQMLASISGLSPYVHDALVIYTGGGVSIAQVREGARHVAELQREMDRTRRERLQSLGFEPQLAANMSAYHTKNFM
ncbi:MAG TPA: ferritin-like domain-containing protein [Candidatus Acidoferrales bacterium]|nr:ferritin-like domain-containing protein [Candidatus Acidoferrales bacterium]